MIIKSLSRRNNSFSQLAGYLLRKPKDNCFKTTGSYVRDLADNLLSYISSSHQPGNPTITRNLGALALSPSSICNAFKINAALMPKRRNGISLYHEILAFSPQDSAHITPDMLVDLTHHYLQLRAPKALAFAKIHFDKDHAHVHIMLSANDKGVARRNRLSRKEFATIKTKLEAYQIAQYPELTHSIAQPAHTSVKTLPPPSPLPDALTTQQLAANAARKLSKSELKALILQTLTLAHSSDEFLAKLKISGFELVTRGRTITLINAQNKQRARLKTLGVIEQYLQAKNAWERLPKRLDELQEINRRHLLYEWRELGFAARIMKILEPLIPPLRHIEKRLSELRQIRQDQQRKSDRSR